MGSSLGSRPGWARRSLAPFAAGLLLLPLLAAPPAPAAGGWAGDALVTCFGPDTDVMLVLDTSRSMRQGELTIAKEGAVRLVENLTASDRSGLVRFGNGASLKKSLDADHRATEAAVEALKIDSTSGTSTAAGISLGHSETLKNGRIDSRRVMVLLTDGFTTTGDPIAKAKLAKADGIEIFAIGVGDDVNEKELKAIASEPVSEHFFHPPTFEDLLAVFEAITHSLLKPSVVGEAYAARATASSPAEGTKVVVAKVNQRIMPNGSAGGMREQTFELSPPGLNVTLALVETAAAGAATRDAAQASAQARLAGVRVRDVATGAPLLTATLLASGARAVADPARAVATDEGTSVAGLAILGVPVSGGAPPNTNVTVPGFGRLVLNEQVPGGGPGHAYLLVNAARLTVERDGRTVDVVLGSAFAGASCGISPPFDPPAPEQGDAVQVVAPKPPGLPPG